MCEIMTTITNPGNLRQYKSRFSVIVEQILVVFSSTNLARVVKICLNFLNKLRDDVLSYR